MLLLLIASQLPFLEADPDINISYSRGPFTDEGLNTSQIRNLVNHGELEMNECDNLLKTPLFNLYLLFPFTVFGTKLAVARFFVLIFMIGLILRMGINENFRIVLMLFIPLTLFRYPVFHFSHFSLSEIMAASLVMLALFHLSTYLLKAEKRKPVNLFLTGLFVALAYFVKLQFIYLLPLIPMVMIVLILLKNDFNLRWKDAGIAIFYQLIFLLIYLVAWYLPFRETYDHMMQYQSGGFYINSHTFDQLRFNLRYYFFSGTAIIYSVVFMVSLLSGFYLYKSASSFFKATFIMALAWNLLEWHKLVMEYLPTRYLISLYIASGLLVALVIFELSKHFSIKAKGYAIGVPVVVVVMLIFGLNLVDYAHSIKDRTYKIREVNKYLATGNFEDRPAIGAWAPSLSWASGARSFPVWYEFLNDEDPVEAYHPRAIISEADEEDSNQAYLNQGIDLAAIADSSRNFEIGRWEVVVYWLPD